LFVGVFLTGRTIQDSRSNKFGRATRTTYSSTHGRTRLPWPSRPSLLIGPGGGTIIVQLAAGAGPAGPVVYCMAALRRRLWTWHVKEATK